MKLQDLPMMGVRYMARKGTLVLVRWDLNNGRFAYSVDRISRGCGCSLIFRDGWAGREEVIHFFAEACKKQRKGKYDFNLNVYRCE